MASYKEKNGTSFMGDLLRKGKDLGLDIAPEILNVAGTLTGINGLKKLGELIDDDPNIPEAAGVEIMHMAKLHVDNTQGARDMQMAALQQEDTFSKRFVYYLATFWSVVSAVYFFLATFTHVVNERVSDTILGFLLGTIIGTIINFFFGSSKGSKDKALQLLKK